MLVKMLKIHVMFKKFGFVKKMFKKILGFEVMIEVMMQLIWLGLGFGLETLAAAAALAALGKSSLGLR